MDGVLGMPGWHWLFLLGGLSCVVLGLLALKLKDRIDDAGWLSSAEKSLLAAQIAQQSRPAETGHSLLGALKKPGFLTLGLVYVLIQVASYGLNFWAPHLIHVAGTKNPTVVGLLTAVPYVCGTIGMVVVGRRSDDVGTRLLRRGILRQADHLAGGRACRDGRGRGRVDPGILGAAAKAADGRGRRAVSR